MTYSRSIFATLILLFGIGQAAAQTAEVKSEPFIRTTGEATVTVKPDRAQIDVGVVTQAVTSQSAVSQNAQKQDATIAKLRGILGSAAEIKTISFSVTPVYRYPREGGNPTITGYSATNIVRVTLDDLSKVGDAIDAAVTGGSNQIQNLRFILKDEAPHEAEALSKAAVQARSKANSLASALNVRVTRILSVSETSSPVYPVRDVAFARAETAASTPIEPGTIEVKATVTLTVEIAQ